MEEASPYLYTAALGRGEDRVRVPQESNSSMKGGRGFGSPSQKLLNNYRMARPEKESSLSLEVCKSLDWWGGCAQLNEALDCLQALFSLQDMPGY